MLEEDKLILVGYVKGKIEELTIKVAELKDALPSAKTELEKMKTEAKIIVAQKEIEYYCSRLDTLEIQKEDNITPKM